MRRGYDMKEQEQLQSKYTRKRTMGEVDQGRTEKRRKCDQGGEIVDKYDRTIAQAEITIDPEAVIRQLLIELASAWNEKETLIRKYDDLIDKNEKGKEALRAAQQEKARLRSFDEDELTDDEDESMDNESDVEMAEVPSCSTSQPVLSIELVRAKLEQLFLTNSERRLGEAKTTIDQEAVTRQLRADLVSARKENVKLTRKCEDLIFRTAKLKQDRRAVKQEIARQVLCPTRKGSVGRQSGSALSTCSMVCSWGASQLSVDDFESNLTQRSVPSTHPLLW